jgi:hypothetical protein
MVLSLAILIVTAAPDGTVESASGGQNTESAQKRFWTHSCWTDKRGHYRCQRVAHLASAPNSATFKLI